MRFGEWHVQVITMPGYMLNRVYLMQHEGSTTSFLTKDNTLVTAKPGELTRDDLYFVEMDDDQLQAFADALAGRGIKTSNDHKNEGLLEATREHLNDMRRITYKKLGLEDSKDA